MNDQQRPRPALHFTAHHGWTNDPHGLINVDGQYHMFFQYNPDGTEWSPVCHWGHAVSPDLIRWTEIEVALSPENGEVGCWSGSAVVDEAGPVLLYTRIASDDWGQGQVALARPRQGMSDWHRKPAASVISGPPEGQPIIAFRDPFVWRTDDRWTAVLGAGLVGVGGCAIQYSSTNLETWTCDGIIAQKPDSERDPEWTGKVWECPQLFELDGTWVLLVSVWDDDVLHHVVYALGDYDGHRFQASTWDRFSYGTQLYATTAFTDVDGRRCAMSWMREQDNLAPAGSAWASAMSLPHVLRVRGERLVVGQHPDLDTHFSVNHPVSNITRDHSNQLDPVGPVWRATMNIPTQPAGHTELHVTHGGTPSWRIELDTGKQQLQVSTSDGTSLLTMPITTTAGTLDIVTDTDIVEITWSAGSGIAAARIPTNPTAELIITGTLNLDQVIIHEPSTVPVS